MGIEDLRRRRDERRAKGVPPGVYPQHAGKATAAKGEPAPRAVALPVIGCANEGNILERCEKCGAGGKHVRECDVHGKCTHQPVNPKVMDCARCRRDGLGYAPDPAELTAAMRGHFNPSLAKIGGQWVLASRLGWTGSRLHLTRLDGDLRPTSPPTPLALDHPLCRAGREDPRLFTFRGKPHLSFTGVERVGTGDFRTHQMLAELSDDLKPVNVWAPSYAGRSLPKEKNWTFFEGDDGELYSVYSVSPEHVVLRHRGTQAEEVTRVPWNPVWGGHGHLRGGASPVRVGDEFFHFFHGMTWDEKLKVKKYSLGVYTFDAAPPFAPRRGPALLLTPPADRPGWYASVVFPGGAALDGDAWRVSYGVHDERYEVGTWTRAEVDAALNEATDGIPANLAPLIARATSDAQPGWCSPEKAASAAEIVLRERPAVCVEVGVFGGRWTLAVAAALRHVGAGVVHAIDPWNTAPGAEGTHAEEYRAWWQSVDLPGAKAKFLAARDEMGLAPWVRVREQSSRAAAWAFDKGSIDLIHVDGNHSPEESTADVRAWLPLVKPGGWVAFDDSHWPSVAGALSLLDAACELIRDYGTWRLYRVR